MTTTAAPASSSNRTVHLPTDAPISGCKPAVLKGLRLSALKNGETARVVRLAFPDAGCRKRFAEMGLAEGMKVTVATTGETMMLIVGGARLGMAARCADEIVVARVAK